MSARLWSEDCKTAEAEVARLHELVDRLRAANDRLAAERDRRAEAERDRLRGHVVSRLRAMASRPENVLAMRALIEATREFEEPPPAPAGPLDWEAIKEQARKVGQAAGWIDEGAFATAAFGEQVRKLVGLCGWEVRP